MRPGPVPVPSPIRAARNPRFKPPANEPRPRAMVPRCPEHVKADKIALRAWRHYVHLLARMRVLTEADASVVADLAIMQSCYLRAWDFVRRCNEAGKTGLEGQIIKTKTDYLAESMAFSQVKALTEIKRRLYAELGLTPAARPRIQTAGLKPQESNPFLALG